MLVEPPRSNYDLNFRLFRFPVRVHPFFWLGALALGITGSRPRLDEVLIWVAVVFASILVHELGHALAFRWFGSDSHIVLYVFGGLAVPWAEVRGRWRRVVIALAGPAAGFALAGLVWGSNRLAPWRAPGLPGVLYGYLFFVNLFWGLINLLPVYPLDGGQVAHEVCSSIWGRRGPRIALRVSIVVAVLMAVYGLACAADPSAPWLKHVPWWLPGSLWSAILFGMLAGLSYQRLQQLRSIDSHWMDDDDRPPWRR